MSDECLHGESFSDAVEYLRVFVFVLFCFLEERERESVHSVVYVTAAIKYRDSDFPLNVTDVELTVSVDVRYTVPAMTFKSCCNKHDIM